MTTSKPSTITIIAEIGNTHEGSIYLAKEMITSAAESGANIVKFQTHLFEFESLSNAPTPYYFTGESRQSYLTRTSFNLSQLRELKSHCEGQGVDFMSSAFSIEAIDLLEELQVKYHKVPSGEVNNIPFLIHLAKTNKPVFLSSGMSYLHEIQEAIDILKKYGCPRIILFQCTSEYPCTPQHSGIRFISQLKEQFNLEIGLSDHTLGNEIAISSVSLGATFLEKHFTLSKKMYGADARFSSEPEEFRQMVFSIRNVEKALHSELTKDQITEKLLHMKQTFEKYIVLKKNLVRGHQLTFDDLSFKKSGIIGIPASQYQTVLNKKINCNCQLNTLLTMDLLY